MVVVVYHYLSALCHTALRHKLAQSSTIHKQTTHLHKTVDLDDVSFTYTVYKSVKDQQGIESSVRHYVPKRAFHMVWIAAAVLWCGKPGTGVCYIYSTSYKLLG